MKNEDYVMIYALGDNIPVGVLRECYTEKIFKQSDLTTDFTSTIKREYFTKQIPQEKSQQINEELRVVDMSIRGLDNEKYFLNKKVSPISGAVVILPK